MRTLIILMSLMVLLIAPSVHAAPQALNDEQIEQIRRNCQTSQGYLQQIQRNDAAARINRGRAYESLSKLITNFNSRVVVNRLDAPALVTVSSAVSKRISDFQSDYLQYEDKLSAALRIKCREQPVTYYDTLTSARELRTRVAKDVQDINTLLDDYQKGVTTLKTQLSETKAEAAQ